MRSQAVRLCPRARQLVLLSENGDICPSGISRIARSASSAAISSSCGNNATATPQAVTTVVPNAAAATPPAAAAAAAKTVTAPPKPGTPATSHAPVTGISPGNPNKGPPVPPGTPAAAGGSTGGAEGGKSGGGSKLPLLLLAAAGVGGYYAYEKGYLDNISGLGPQVWDPVKKGLGQIQQEVQKLSQKLQQEPQKPPTPTTTTPTTSSSQDSLSAAADEFPGSSSSSGPATTAAAPPATPKATTPTTTSSSSSGAPPATGTPPAPTRTSLQALGVSPETKEDKEATALVNRLTEFMATQAAVAAASAATDVAAVEASKTDGQQTKSAATAATAPAATATATAAPPAAAAGLTSSGVGVAPVKRVEEARRAVAQVLGDVDQAGATALTPEQLVKAAEGTDFGPSGFGDYGIHLKQATADAAAFAKVLQPLVERQKKLEGEIRGLMQEREHLMRDAKGQLDEVTSRFKELLAEQARVAEEMKERAVKAAEQKVAAEASQAQLQERRERLKVLEQLRGKVNTLDRALELRSAGSRLSTAAHRLSVGVVGLATALDQGTPFDQELQLIHAAAAAAAAGSPAAGDTGASGASASDTGATTSGDGAGGGVGLEALVSSVLATLPPQAATKGLPTLSDLEARFPSVVSAASRMSYFPTGAGGMLAHAVAAAAAALKVEEGAALGQKQQEDAAAGLASQLAKARQQLRDRDLAAAADTLMAATAGTEAAAAVADWVADARARAAADQAVAFLRAYATCAGAAVA